MRLGVYIRNKLRSRIRLPVAEDRREPLTREIDDWKVSTNFAGKLTVTLEAIRFRVEEEADGERRRPFSPMVNLPVSPREESRWIEFLDTVEPSYLKVLVDREVGEILDGGIDAYILKYYGGVKGVQRKKSNSDRCVGDGGSSLIPAG